MRLGLCCKFLEEPIRFRITTAKNLSNLDRNAQIDKLSELCLSNAQSLFQSINYCTDNHIGCFRVNSQFFPLKTHPDIMYDMNDLPDVEQIKKILSDCKNFSTDKNIRLTFHPDQFILLSSPKKDVVEKSIADLNYQAELSELIGADVINIHGGGAYGDKQSALNRMEKIFSGLDDRIKSRLTFENDDRVYTPSDLLPFCKKHNVPLVYDVHHHRCLPDGLSIAEATEAALSTWNREPLFHISSPRNTWKGAYPGYHHDYIDINDFPEKWIGLDITVEVEAKAKEVAVKKLYNQLKNRQ